MIYGVDFSGSLTDILAQFLLDKFRDNPFQIAQTKIILPTRRSCQTLKESFLKRTQNQATFLPQMVPLYEIDDLDVDLPDAISKWERLFLLTKLCQAKPNLHDTAKAFQVAMSLAELLDLSYQYHTQFENLAELVPTEAFAEHWQETVQFLDIIHTEWPKILSEHNQIDAQDRLQRLIYLKAQKILKNPIYTIVAGLTADFPAVGELIQSVYQTGGDIFLDGVDKNFLLGNPKPSQIHPQYLIHKTIQTLKIPPNQITFLSHPTPTEEWVEQAFRSDVWYPSDLSPNCVQNIKYIQADSAEQEAITIALHLRQVLETPDKTATFVTTDRNLARRVITHMKRWHINLDDSAGLPVNHTPVGSFLLQILSWAKNPQSYTEQLALYKHPLFSDCCATGKKHIEIKNLEKNARQKHQAFRIPLNTNGDLFAQYFRIPQLIDFQKLLSQHLELAEKWATTDTTAGTDILWENPIGQQLFQLLSEMKNRAPVLGDINTQEYPALFEMILGTIAARVPYGYARRINVLGPIENRFHHSDVCIIGGLNEQVFPPVAETGPWLNRLMRLKLGLPDTEAHTATLTHDFMHCMGAKEVILTRATKVSGTPTVPSRFLERLQMVAQINGFEIPTFNAHLANLLDTPNESQKIIRPRPCPKKSIRPRQLSVTNIELLKRNPYAIYAKYILSLYPLDDWDKPAQPSLYGQAIHSTLSELLKDVRQLPTPQQMQDTFHQKLSDTNLSKADCLFCESIFQKYLIPFILQEQTQLQKHHIKTYNEIKGEITFDIHHQPYTLTARVDRIDVYPQNLATVIDYKTGTPPAFSKVINGESPQLTLEAWMLLQGAFPKINVSEIQDLEYWHLGRSPKRHHFNKTVKDYTLKQVITKTAEGLKVLLENFDSDETPYDVCPVKFLEPKYNDYKNLARIPEWAHSDDEGEEDHA